MAFTYASWPAILMYVDHTYVHSSDCAKLVRIKVTEEKYYGQPKQSGKPAVPNVRFRANSNRATELIHYVVCPIAEHFLVHEFARKFRYVSR